MEFKCIACENNFKLYARKLVDGSLDISAGGYIRNKLTGENCGRHVDIYIQFYDNDGKLLAKPISNKDDYEFIYSNS